MHATGGVLGEQGVELRAIEPVGVVVEDGGALRFAQWPSRSACSAAAHDDTALEEHEPQLGVALGHAAEEQRPGRGLGRGTEAAEVVVEVVDGGHAGAPALATGVEAGRHAQLGARAPHRLVVERRVVGEGVHPLGRRLLGARPGPGHDPAEHDRLQPQLLDRVVQLGDGFARIGHRDHGNGLEPVTQAVEHLDRVPVERGAANTARSSGTAGSPAKNPYVG